MYVLVVHACTDYEYIAPVIIIGGRGLVCEAIIPMQDTC